MTIYSIHKNFLTAEEFAGFQDELTKLWNYEHGDESKTEIENAKIVFKLEKLPETVLKPISLIAGDLGKEKIRELTGWDGELYSLLEFDDFGGYAPLHTMTANGYLGSHVDHTHIKDGEYIHVANAIYYASPNWEANWGGSTVIYDSTGFKEISRIFPIPNSLFIFSHDCESFHGVDRLQTPIGIHRITIYMDYYVKAADLSLFKDKFREISNSEFIYSKWHTTFIPFNFEKGRVNLKSIFNRAFIGYLKNYLSYSIEKNTAKSISGIKYCEICNNAYKFIRYIFNLSSQFKKKN